MFPQRAHITQLLTLGLPLVGSQLAQAAIHIVDTAMLGRYDLEILAGVVLATTLWFTVFIVGSGFAFAVTPLVAATAEAPARQRRIARMGLWISFGFAGMCLPVVLSGALVLRALGQPAVLSEIAGSYLSIAGWGLFPSLAVAVLKGFLAARHRSDVVLWVTLGAVVVNAGLNWVLIFGTLGFPEMGARGAALASVLTQVASLMALGWFLRRGFPELQVFRRLWRPDWDELVQVFRLGWPIGVSTLAEVALFSASTIMMGWIGVVSLAAHDIALQVALVTFNVHLGLSQAATVIAGQAFARQDPAGLRAIGKAALWSSGVVALASLLVMLAIPRPLVAIFADPADPLRDQILTTGALFVGLAGLFQLADGVQVVMISLLRGVQDTRGPMWLTVISYWGVGAPLAYVLGIMLGVGGAGVWLGLLAGLTVAAVLLGRRYWTHDALVMGRR